MKTKFIKVSVSEQGLPKTEGKFLCQIKEREGKFIWQSFYPDESVFIEQWQRDVEFYFLEVPDREDEMREVLEEARTVIARMKRSMLVHPDHEEGSEFDDLTTSAQEMENKISEYLTN